MQPKVVIAALKRVAAESIEIQPSAARDENLRFATRCIVETLEVVPPGAVFVKLVKHKQRRGGELSAIFGLACLRPPAQRESTLVFVMVYGAPLAGV